MNPDPAGGPDPSGPAKRRVITVVNQKGGSTKTTTAVGLAYGLVKLGLRVRIWDADPQGGSVTLWLPPQQPVGEGLLEVYRRAATVDEVTSLTNFENLYIVPSWPSMREVEQLRKPGSEMVLKAAVVSSTAPVDVEVIDATHTMDVIAAGAVTAADELVIPLQPSELDMGGMTELLDMIAAVRTYYTPQLRIAAIVIGFANPKAGYDLSVIDDFAAAYPDAVVTYVPMSVKMREAVAVHAPHQVHVKSAKNAVNIQFAALAQSFVDRWKEENS
jgi:chromosome partitioning protein